MSACETVLAPGLAAYQQLTDAGRFCDLAAFDDNLAALCQGATGAARNRALAQADEKMLCAVFCCCSAHPVPSENGQGGYDTCANQTLGAAEDFMDNDSRFKSQVSYNMRPDTPEPLMERGLFGGLTTDSIPWTQSGIAHIKNRIGQDGFPYQSGDARRPDVVIVRDPSRPPTADRQPRTTSAGSWISSSRTGSIQNSKRPTPASAASLRRSSTARHATAPTMRPKSTSNWSRQRKA